MWHKKFQLLCKGIAHAAEKIDQKLVLPMKFSIIVIKVWVAIRNGNILLHIYQVVHLSLKYIL